MKFSLFVSTIIISIVITACDPTYQVDYKVLNETGKPLTVIVEHTDQRKDTSIIAHETELIFFNDFGIGLSTSDFLDGLTFLPVELTLLNNEGISFNKNLQDISNWHKFYSGKRSNDVGVVQLRVSPDDFQ